MAHPEYDREPKLGLQIRDERRPSRSFSFCDWAQREGFEYPTHATPMLGRVGSPAEAYFIRGLFDLPGVIYDGGDRAFVRNTTMRVQVQCKQYVIDATAERDDCRLAIEIDGLAFHRATQEQVAADYFRERRLLIAGYIVVRFTAAEAMSNTRQCWRDVSAVLACHARRAA